MTYVLGTGTETQVSFGEDNAIAFSVTRLANGNYVFSWYGGDVISDPTYPAGWYWAHIHTRMFSPTGQAVGPLVTISEDGLDNYLPITTALADGGYLMVWSRAANYNSETLEPADSRLLVQRYDAAGHPVSLTPGGGDTGPVTLVATDLHFGAIHAVTTLNNGGFVISWQTLSDTMTHLATFDAGGTLTAVTNVATNANEMQAEMATLSDGSYLRYFVASALAGQPDATFDIYVQHYAADGTAMGATVIANTTTAGSQQWPHVSVFDGGYVMTYTSPDGSSTGILGQIFHNDGSKVGAEFQVNAVTADRQYAPEVAVLSDGNFVIAWRSNLQDGSGYGVYYQLFSAAGAKIGAETRIADETAGNQLYVHIEALIGGGFTAFWSGPDVDGHMSNFQRTYLPESGSGTAGDDVINGSDNANILSGLGGNDTMDGRGGNDNLDGGTGNDVLIGGLGDDTLKGSAGDDGLNGSVGADRMSGGAGNDTYYVDNAGDKVFEFTTAGVDDGGRDRVVSSITYSLGAFVEDLYVTGVTNGTGNGLDNTIVGDVNTNVLRGMAGNDVLDEGNGGNDKLYGGAGNDTYVLHAKGRVYEDSVAGVDDGGIDTVISSGSYVLGNFVENLTLVDTAVSATGNGLNNVLRGNGLSNKLDGLTGADTMYGGGGDDYYYVDNASDVVSEQTAPGVNDGGVDRVTSTVDFTLGSYIENLVLSGANAINGTGNDLANTITGNGASNRIAGMAGNDTLTGGAGGDDFVFAHFGSANGNDHIKDFVSGTDRMVFRAADFGWGGGHVLTSAELSLTGAAVGTNKQFVYDPVSHQLYWDSNGSSAGGSVAVVAFDNGAAPQLSDFVFEADSPVGTGLAPGTNLTYVARFVDKDGNVIASDGNNGWIGLNGFFPNISGFPGGVPEGTVSLNFGSDKASVPLLSATGHQDGIGLEVEAYQTVGGILQLVDQYLFENSKVLGASADASGNSYTLKVGRFERDHYVRDGKGVLQSSSEFGWDFAAQSKANLSDHADFKVDGSVAGGTVSGLSYVVRFFDAKGTVIASEGSNGWVRSSGVSTVFNADSNGLPEAILSFSAGKLAAALTNALEQDNVLSIEVEAYKTTASGQVSVDETLFKNAHLTWQNVGLAGTDAPKDVLSFQYGQIEQTHTSLSSDGKLGVPTRAGWDFVTKSDVNLSDPGDFSAGDTAGNAPAERLLVGRFVDSGGKTIASEGTNGWIKLDSFNFMPSAANFGGVTADPFTAQVSTSGSDKLAVALEQQQLTDAHISFQVESLALIGGQYRLVDEYLFAGASTAASSFAAGGSDSLMFNTAAFTHTIISHDAKGGETGTTSTGWDIGTHTPVNLPDPADYLPGSDTAATHTEALTTVVRFLTADGKSIIASDNGAGGWVSGSASLYLSEGSGTGGGGSISITDDAVMVALESALLRGDRIGVDIETYRTSAAGLQLVDDYLIAKASVTGLAPGEHGGVSFAMGQYSHLHNQYDAKNGLTGSSTVGWDFATKTSTTLSDLGNYATGGVASTTLAPAVAQTYYARFVDSKGAPIASDGDGGWIKLSTAGLGLNNNGFSPADTYIVLTFGDDHAAQALNTAFLGGYTNLGLEIDAFAGSRLIDQSLFTHVGVAQFDIGDGTTTVQLSDGQTQTTHYAYDAKGSPHTTSYGWDFASSSPTTLTSAGAYVPGSAAGGSTAAISWYMRLVDDNGRTIVTDGGARFSKIDGVAFSNDPTFGASVNVQAGSDQTILAAYESALASHPLARLEIEGYALDGKGVLHIVDEYLLDHVQAYSVVDVGPTLGGYIIFASDKAQLAHYSYPGGAQVDIWGWDYALDHAVVLGTPHADVFT